MSASCLDTTGLSVERQWESFGVENPRLLDLDLHLEERDRLVSRLEDEGDWDSARKLSECGNEMPMICTCCGARRIVHTKCDRRYCPLCAPRLAAERVRKFQAAVLGMKWPLHVTLTVTNKENLQRKSLVELLKCFRRLRQRRLWKCNVLGGFASLELTNKGKGWHPHLHVLCDCEWLSLQTSPPAKWMSKNQQKHVFQKASAELGEAWAELVGQKTASVRVRRCYGKQGNVRAAIEVMKYAVKPGALLECKGKASDVVAAMKGTRLFRGFGSCYRLKLDADKSPLPCETCEATGSMLPEFVVEIMSKRDFSKWHGSTRTARS